MSDPAAKGTRSATSKSGETARELLRRSKQITRRLAALAAVPFEPDSLIIPPSSSRAWLARLRGELPARTVGYRTAPRSPISADVGQSGRRPVL